MKKCIKKTSKDAEGKVIEDIQHINWIEAQKLVNSKSGWVFCPKKEWKDKVRDKNKKVERVPDKKGLNKSEEGLKKRSKYSRKQVEQVGPVEVTEKVEKTEKTEKIEKIEKKVEKVEGTK